MIVHLEQQALILLHLRVIVPLVVGFQVQRVVSSAESGSKCREWRRHVSMSIEIE
jgi:hypothetical protein